MTDIVKQILARPIQLADQVIKSADESCINKQDCAELKSKTEKLAGLLRQAARASNDLYERPTKRIIEHTEQVLDKALSLVLKCRNNGLVKRVFTIISAAAFRKMSIQLEDSILDVSWLLRVSAPNNSTDEYLGVPPIAANEPILCFIWEQIAILYTGTLDDRSDAAASLVSLARDNDWYGKLIIEEGGVTPLLKLAKEGKLDGQENAALAIGLLGRDPESVEHMIHAGVCSVFVKILKEGPMKVQAVVAWAVAELVAHYPKCQDLFAQHKRYTLEEVLSATNNFSQENLISEGALGKVYQGQIRFHGNLVVQRFDCKYGQGDELQTQISTIKSLEHKNIVPLLGYCDENNEKILIYKAFWGTLNLYISHPTLTWPQRLQICLGVARALDHVHYDVIHCDINSSKIILDYGWEPKIYGFERSTKYPQSWRHRLLFSRYFDTNNLTPKYDVYFFGVLLLEVLCGRKPIITNDGVQEELKKIIDPNLMNQMDTQTFTAFTNIASKCLNQQPMQRPTMDQIVKELEEVLELQWKHAGLELSKAADEGTPFNSLKKIPISEIRQATNDFSIECLVGSGGYAHVYRAKLSIQSLSSMEGKSNDEVPKISKHVAIKRITKGADEQAKQGFLTEIELLSSCKHANILSLLGFSDEASEMILVYEFAFKGSLADYLERSDTAILTWAQRIQICLDIAEGIKYLHTNMEGKPRIIHRDIKSDNILFDENMNAKLADFGLSKSHPNQQSSAIYSKNVAGTDLYLDPEYLATGKYKRESDIYSFGVVLFEILSGRVAYDPIYTNENELGLAPVARRRFSEGTLKELIDPKISEEDDGHVFTLNRRPNQDSFHTFSKIANQCLAETQAKRPTIEVVIKELQNALKLQGETAVLLRFRLSDIVLATENFAETCRIGLDSIGMVHKAELDHLSNNSEGKNIGEPSNSRITVAIKHITSREGGQGKHEFFEEFEMRTSFKHPNIVSLLGFCDEGDELILVYEPVSGRSLDHYLKTADQMATFTWTQRLHTCLEVARAFNHLHTMMVNPLRVIQIDTKSANILLDDKSRVKLAYSVISKLNPPNQEPGVKVYVDPEYETTGELKTEYDVYSFGVVLSEIFCGRVAYDPIYMKENEKGLAPIARGCFKDGSIERIMDPSLMEEMSKSSRGLDMRSLKAFVKIAGQCLGEAAERPTMEVVIRELESALNYQVGTEKK